MDEDEEEGWRKEGRKREKRGWEEESEKGEGRRAKWGRCGKRVLGDRGGRDMVGMWVKRISGAVFLSFPLRFSLQYLPHAFPSPSLFLLSPMSPVSHFISFYVSPSFVSHLLPPFLNWNNIKFSFLSVLQSPNLNYWFLGTAVYFAIENSFSFDKFSFIIP